ncbi:helix-turn-helix transcriptional regulator [uncultured Tateyamaria sp.]|uniref:helix-turn-helix domain-containing protein n=1 Tax=uncultured Tateyamaria sp. TaxID=455651 RepID=UPI002602AD09|nr:helix-turn-helix transcriptional regulator [uncultured Tateyamaria sp.]
MDTLFERIKDARERAGLTVNQAAEALGVKRTQIWRMENRSETLTAERLFELADLYGVDARKLFQGDTASASPDRLYDLIGAVVIMVEECVQTLDARPPPDLIRDAVVEVLRQEGNQPPEIRVKGFDATRYQGLVTLIFKQAKTK